MAIRPNGTAHRQLRTLFQLGTIGDLTDGQLLERFATGHREASELAFAALVDRHGPLVLRVCRAVLRDEHDAQDAFQATFLVLVRKARSLWVRDSLGPWLHAVAHRAARCARSSRERRRSFERGSDAIDPDRFLVAGHPEDVGEVLHDEVERLPERYRAPVVLCDLEGLTHEQAARHLGCPVGTIKSRLSRGRQRLRDRLTRLGLAPGAGLGAVPAATVARVLVPPSLVRSTLGIALRFAPGRATGASIPAAVSTLAQGVSTAMIHATLTQLAIPVLALALAAGAVLDARGGGPSPAPPGRARPAPPAARQFDDDLDEGDDLLLYEIKAGGRPVTVSARGNLEASQVDEVRSPVEGRTTILSILPEGTRVVKDQLVCELDSAPLGDRQAAQQIVTNRAKADYDAASKTVEVAKVNVREYLEGIYPQEVETLEGEITLAEKELERAKDRLDWSDEMLKLGYLSRDQNASDKYDLERARFTLEQARKKLEVLKEYTKPKTVKALEADVERTRAAMLDGQSSWQLEQDKEQALREQIDRCKLFAPAPGIVVYPTLEPRPGEEDRPQIREGAEVREGQPIFSFFELDCPMRVNIKVPEAPIHYVAPGQRARIRVDAFTNRSFDGTVIEVKPLPDPTSFFRNPDKVYTTLVELEGRPPGLRHGMSAEARILVSDADEITVPRRVVLVHDDRAYLAVRRPDGGFEWRSVTIGRSDDAYFEVAAGVRPGELVALDPIAVLRRGTEADPPSPSADPDPADG